MLELDKENKELGIIPDWDDVRTVYDRMDAQRLLNQRNPPGTIVGHILSLAVFARAARYQEDWFDMEQFIYRYCSAKNIDHDALMERLADFLECSGHWVTDPIEMLEGLSKL